MPAHSRCQRKICCTKIRPTAVSARGSRARSNRSSIVIGTIAGVSVIEAVQLFDRLRIDDPVGATSVHLVHGIFGTLCVGLFGVKGLSGLPNDGLFRGGGFAQLGPQLEAVIAVGVFSFSASFAVWRAIDRVTGLRVSAANEELGLDASEMGMEAYAESGQP